MCDLIVCQLAVTCGLCPPLVTLPRSLSCPSGSGLQKPAGVGFVASRLHFPLDRPSRSPLPLEQVALLGALTICHADEHVLSSPLVHQCLQLHQAQQLATHRSDPVSPTTPSPGATPAADLDPPGCAGSGPPSASVGVAPGRGTQTTQMCRA